MTPGGFEAGELVWSSSWYWVLSRLSRRSEVATLHWWMGWNIQRAFAHAELEVLDAEEEDEDPLEEEDEVEEDLDSEVLNVEEEDEEVVVLDSRSLVVDSSVVVVGVSVAVGDSPPPPPPVSVVGESPPPSPPPPPPPPVSVGPFGFWVLVGKSPPPPPPHRHLLCVELGVPPSRVGFWLEIGVSPPPVGFWVELRFWAELGLFSPPLDFDSNSRRRRTGNYWPELVLSVGSTLLVTPELDGCEDGPAKPVEWAAEEPNLELRIFVVWWSAGLGIFETITPEEVRDSNKGAVIAEETDPVGPPDEAPYCDGVTDAADDILQEETDGSEAFFEDLWVKVNENRPDEFVKWAALDCKLKRTGETEISELMVVLGAVLSAGAVVGRGGFGVVGRDSGRIKVARSP
ncbi:hypothetical protein B0H13DRAFT_1876894 [Mycena leptocephala]|nr:hypothetical protein B0H13DRAFT_1876894 [Mycena leptocephala]